MNVIFLDVDGVLNSIDHLIEVYNLTHKTYCLFEVPFDEKCINNLAYLVRNTNSRIVISSNWRMSEEGITKLLEVLNNYNLADSVIGYTPILNNATRGQEIKIFLDKMDIDRFVIIDDYNDMGELTSRLVKTDMRKGLTYENVLEAIEVLNQPLSEKFQKKLD